jgi:hypothetical protein
MLGEEMATWGIFTWGGGGTEGGQTSVIGIPNWLHDNVWKGLAGTEKKDV